jgi:hypothetical protein
MRKGGERGLHQTPRLLKMKKSLSILDAAINPVTALPDKP